MMWMTRLLVFSCWQGVWQEVLLQVSVRDEDYFDSISTGKMSKDYAEACWFLHVRTRDWQQALEPVEWAFDGWQHEPHSCGQNSRCLFRT